MCVWTDRHTHTQSRAITHNSAACPVVTSCDTFYFQKCQNTLKLMKSSEVRLRSKKKILWVFVFLTFFVAEPLRKITKHMKLLYKTELTTVLMITHPSVAASRLTGKSGAEQGS